MLLGDVPGRWPVLQAGDGIARLTGFPVEALVGRTWPPLWDGEGDADAVGRLEAALRDERPCSVELPTLRHAAEPLPSVVSLAPLRGAAGERSVICVVRDARTAEDPGHRDEVTGLANRRALLRDLPAALSRALRNGWSVALVYLDLDRFKAVNDTYGHAAGDAVLREAARRLRTAVRAHDVVARLGGDEFVLLLSDLVTDADAAAAAVIAHATAALTAPFALPDGGGAHVGVSAGCSVFPRDGSDGASLLADADAKMYRSKHAHRAARLDIGVELDRLVERAANARREALANRRTSDDLRREFARRRESGPRE
jgi:diguanylate cyclase (GGDEF)-like protein